VERAADFGAEESGRQSEKKIGSLGQRERDFDARSNLEKLKSTSVHRSPDSVLGSDELASSSRSILSSRDASRRNSKLEKGCEGGLKKDSSRRSLRRSKSDDLSDSSRSLSSNRQNRSSDRSKQTVRKSDTLVSRSDHVGSIYGYGGKKQLRSGDGGSIAGEDASEGSDCTEESSRSASSRCSQRDKDIRGMFQFVKSCIIPGSGELDQSERSTRSKRSNRCSTRRKQAENPPAGPQSAPPRFVANSLEDEVLAPVSSAPPRRCPDVAVTAVEDDPLSAPISAPPRPMPPSKMAPKLKPALEPNVRKDETAAPRDRSKSRTRRDRSTSRARTPANDDWASHSVRSILFDPYDQSSLADTSDADLGETKIEVTLNGGRARSSSRSKAPENANDACHSRGRSVGSKTKQTSGKDSDMGSNCGVLSSENNAKRAASPRGRSGSRDRTETEVSRSRSKSVARRHRSSHTTASEKRRSAESQMDDFLSGRFGTTD
jgi:hypothetical protein